MRHLFTILFIILFFTVMLNAQISKLLIGNKSASVSSATYEYFITSDGDTFITSDGDTLKVKVSFNQNEKQDENIIYCNNLFAVLPERKRTT